MGRGLLVLIALVVLAPLASAAAVTLPAWTVGDERRYDISVVEDGAVVQTGDRHVVVTARGPFT